MPPVPPAGPFPISEATMPTWLVRFDEHGQCVSPVTARALLDHLRQSNYSDLLFFAHGWNTDFAGAVAQYGSFLKAFASVLEHHPIGAFNPLFIGITWPSVWMAEDAGPAVASVNAEIQGRIVADVAAPLSPAARDSLYELTDAPKLSPEQALELAQLLAPLIGSAPEEVEEAISVAAEPGALLAAASLIAAARGEAGAADGTNFDDLGPITGPDAVVQGGDGGFDPRDILRMFSLFQMKDRAGSVGARGVATLLRQVQAASSAKLRVLGHSFGCKVMLSAICAPPPLTRPVDSLLLLQPAISHLAMAETVPGRSGPGGYRSVFDRVAGRIFSTYSSRDMPLHGVFHFALRRRADLGEARISAEAAAAGEPPNKYAALGGYGPRGSGQRLIDPIPAPGEDFGDLSGTRLVGLDGSSDRITSHGDITNGYTAWALRRLIAGD